MSNIRNQEAVEFYGDSDVDIEELLERDIDSDSSNDDQETPNHRYKKSESYTPNTNTATQEFRLEQLSNMTINHTVLGYTEQRIKSQIMSLCSALGGTDPTSTTNEYILGLDALACLKDIKNWIKNVDDKKGTWEVASACHDCGLFVNDLVPIMVQTPSKINDSNRNYMNNILLTTLELLVWLTRPLALDLDKASPAQIDLYSKLKIAHIEYKFRSLTYQKGKCLKNVVGVAIPIISANKNERSMRDNVILNLCLNLFGNIVRIKPAEFIKGSRDPSKRKLQVLDAMPAGINKEDISLDSVLNAYKKNKVLAFIQTLTSGLQADFSSEVLATACLEIYYHLYFGVNPETIASQEEIAGRPQSTSTQEVQEKTSLGEAIEARLNLEKGQKRKLFDNNATRHANFGTLLTIHDNEHNFRAISGQSKLLACDVLEVGDSTLSKQQLRSYGFNRSQEATKSNFDISLGGFQNDIKVGPKARIILKKLTKDFVETGFSTLCTQLRKHTGGNDEKSDIFLDFKYFYVMYWILKFERIHSEKQSRRANNYKRYGHIMVCLEDYMIRNILVYKLPNYLDTREYNMLRVTTNCFKEIMLTAMNLHAFEHADKRNLLEEDKEELGRYVTSAEAVLRNIFARESEINILFQLPQDAQKISLPFVDTMVDFTNVFSKVLHYLTSLKVPIMLSKKTRQKSHKYDDFNALESDGGDEFTDLSEQQVNRFKAFDRQRYEELSSLLLHEKIVNTHIWYFEKFPELSEKQVKKCLSYFNKLLHQWEEHFLKLVRLDFMLTLHDLYHCAFSKSTMKDLGRLLDFFMHTLNKLFINAPSILVEPIYLRQATDVEIKTYFLTGDPEPAIGLTTRESVERARRGNIDVRFEDENISLNHKINILVAQLYYSDKIELIKDLCKYLTQWHIEMTKAEDSDFIFIGKKNTYKLDGNTLVKFRKDPYFRLLCETVGIVSSRLLPITEFKLSEHLKMIEVALENPIDSSELEGKIIDENEKTKEKTAIEDFNDEKDEEPEYGYYGEGIINDDLAGDIEEAGQDQLELMEAQLENNSNRVKGKAIKRRREGEAVEGGENKRKRNKDSNKKRSKRRRPHDDRHHDLGLRTEKSKNLSEKYIVSEDDQSDEGEENDFYVRELKLQKFMQRHDGKITSEQYQDIMSGNLDVLYNEDENEIHTLATQNQTKVGGIPNQNFVASLLRSHAEALEQQDEAFDKNTQDKIEENKLGSESDSSSSDSESDLQPQPEPELEPQSESESEIESLGELDIGFEEDVNSNTQKVENSKKSGYLISDDSHVKIMSSVKKKFENVDQTSENLFSGMSNPHKAMHNVIEDDEDGEDLEKEGENTADKFSSLLSAHKAMNNMSQKANKVELKTLIGD